MQNLLSRQNANLPTDSPNKTWNKENPQSLQIIAQLNSLSAALINRIINFVTMASEDRTNLFLMSHNI